MSETRLTWLARTTLRQLGQHQSRNRDNFLATLVPARAFTLTMGIPGTGTGRKVRYSIYVVLLDERVATLPQMQRRNPERDPSKPYVYVGLTSLRVDRRFNFFRATSKREWRLHKFGVRLMPQLYDSFRPMTCEQASQTAKKLADDLRAKGFGVANGACTEAQLYKSILTQPKKAAHTMV